MILRATLNLRQCNPRTPNPATQETGGDKLLSALNYQLKNGLAKA